MPTQKEFKFGDMVIVRGENKDGVFLCVEGKLVGLNSNGGPIIDEVVPKRIEFLYADNIVSATKNTAKKGGK